MAKQKFEVTTFSKGIIGSASESDIPTDASAYSLNINPNSEDGTLRPINEDQSLSTGSKADGKGWSKVLPHRELLKFNKHAADTSTVVHCNTTNVESTAYPNSPRISLTTVGDFSARADGDYILFTGTAGSSASAYDNNGEPQRIKVEGDDIVLIDQNYSDNEQITVDTNRTCQIPFADSNWEKWDPDTTGVTTETTGTSPQWFEVTGTTDADSQEGLKLNVSNLTTPTNGRTYRISADIWWDDGSNPSAGSIFRFNYGSEASSTFEVTATGPGTTYTKDITIDDPSAHLYIYKVGNVNDQWNVNNISVKEVALVTDGTFIVQEEATKFNYANQFFRLHCVTGESTNGLFYVWFSQNKAADILTNGNMEADSNWTSYGTVSVNERSTAQVHGGTYSRKFTVTSVNGGIASDAFTTVTGYRYKLTAWVYPDDSKSITIRTETGDGSDDTSIEVLKNSLGQDLNKDSWNEIHFYWDETGGGSSARLCFINGDTLNASWYIDDAKIQVVEGRDLNADLEDMEDYTSIRVNITDGDTPTTIANLADAYIDEALAQDEIRTANNETYTNQDGTETIVPAGTLYLEHRKDGETDSAVIADTSEDIEDFFILDQNVIEKTITQEGHGTEFPVNDFVAINEEPKEHTLNDNDGGLVMRSDVYTLIGVDYNNNNIYKWNDIYKTEGDATESQDGLETIASGIAHDNASTFAVRNKAIHIGLGNSISAKTKWVGKIDNAQLDNVYNDWYVENDELLPLNENLSPVNYDLIVTMPSWGDSDGGDSSNAFAENQTHHHALTIPNDTGNYASLNKFLNSASVCYTEGAVDNDDTGGLNRFGKIANSAPGIGWIFKVLSIQDLGDEALVKAKQRAYDISVSAVVAGDKFMVVDAGTDSSSDDAVIEFIAFAEYSPFGFGITEGSKKISRLTFTDTTDDNAFDATTTTAVKRYVDYDLTNIIDDSGISTIAPCRSVLTSGNTIGKSGYMNYGDGTIDHNHIADQRSRPLWGMWWISTQAGKLYRVNLMDIDSLHHDDSYKGPKLDCEMTFDYSQIGLCQDNIDSGIFKHWYAGVYGAEYATSGHEGNTKTTDANFQGEDWTGGYTWSKSPTNSKIVGIIETSNSCTDPSVFASITNQTANDRYVYDDDSRNTGDGYNQYGDTVNTGYMDHHHAEIHLTSTKETFTGTNLINVKQPWHGQDVGSVLTMFTYSENTTAADDVGKVENNGNTIVTRLTGHMSFRCLGQYAATEGSKTLYHSTKVWVLYQSKDNTPYTQWDLMLYNFYPSTVTDSNVALVYDRTPPYDEVDIGTRSGPQSSYDSWYQNNLSPSMVNSSVVAQKSSMFHRGEGNWSQRGSYTDTDNHSSNDPKRHIIMRRDGSAVYRDDKSHQLLQGFYGRILGFDGSASTNNPRSILPLNHSLYHLLEPVDLPKDLGTIGSSVSDSTYEDTSGRYNGARLKMFGNKHQVGFLGRVNGKLCMDGLATYYRKHEHHGHVDCHYSQFKTYNNNLVSFTVTDTGSAYNDARTYNASYDYFPSGGGTTRYIAHNQNAHYSDGGRFKKRCHWNLGTLRYTRGSKKDALLYESNKYSSYNGTMLASKTVPHLNTKGRAHNGGVVFQGQIGDYLYIDRKWISTEPCTADGFASASSQEPNIYKNQGIWQMPSGARIYESRGDSASSAYQFGHANARPYVSGTMSKKVRESNGDWFGTHHEGDWNSGNQRPTNGQHMSTGGMNAASKQNQLLSRLGSWDDPVATGATPTGYNSNGTVYDINRWTPSWEIMQQDVVETRIVQETQGTLSKVRTSHHLFNKYLRAVSEHEAPLTAYTGDNAKTGRNNAIFIQGAKSVGNEYVSVFDLASLNYPITVELDARYPENGLKSTAYTKSLVSKSYTDSPKFVSTFHGGYWNKSTNEDNKLFGSGFTGSSQFLSPFNTGLDLQNSSALAHWDDLGTITNYTVFDQLVSVKNENTGSVANFKSGQNIKYKAAFVYDGYQDGPLSPFYFDYDVGVNCESLTVEVKLNTEGTISKRVTHLSIYRKNTDNELYRLVKQIDLTMEEWSYSEEFSSWSHIFTDSRSFASWTAITGMSENVTDFSLNYSLSAQINDQLFVGGAWHSKIEDATKYIFRSKPGNFSQFDYTKDYLVLPAKPTALASYNGKIYAFDRNNIYRIDPLQMIVEDTFEGIGCLSQDSFVVTDYGMCFADINNIYLHDGARPIPIGDNILSVSTYEGWDVGWKNAVKKSEETYRYSPFVFFDGDSNSFVCFIIGSCEQQCNPKVTRVWAYSITRNRWDLWEGPTARKATQGKDGDVLISDRTILYNYKKDSSFRKWKWLSKKLSISKGLSTKRFHRIKSLGSPNAKVFNNPVNWHDDNFLVWVDGEAQPITREDTHYTTSFTGSYILEPLDDSSTTIAIKGLNQGTSKGLNLKHAIGVYLKLDDEIMLLTACNDNGDSITVTRGQMGTTAVAHTNTTAGSGHDSTEGLEGSRLFYVAPSLKLPKKCKGKNIEIQIQQQTAVVDSFQIEFIEKSGR